MSKCAEIWKKIKKTLHRITELIKNFVKALIKGWNDNDPFDPNGQIFSDFLASSPGEEETKYFSVKTSFNFDQPNDPKLFAMDRIDFQMLFQKKPGEEWIICDNECLQTMNPSHDFYYSFLSEETFKLIKKSKNKELSIPGFWYSQDEIILLTALSGDYGRTIDVMEIFKYGALNKEDRGKKYSSESIFIMKN